MKSSELSLSLVLVMLCSLVGLYTFLAVNRTNAPSPSIPSSSPRIISRRQYSASGSEITTTMAAALPKIAFGIAAGSDVWITRKEYIKTWWREERGMRGAVWLDSMVVEEPDDHDHHDHGAARLPPLRISEDTSRFSYTYAAGRGSMRRQRQQLRICRVGIETFRLGLPDVQWFVIGDDDTVFLVDNLVRVLSKYDHTQMHYIGSSSETHRQNTADPCCTSNMAYGGAGYAMSYALVQQLNATLDSCMERYSDLYGGSTRIHACLLELGVPLTREPGLHQFDIGGDASGLLVAHPIAPLLSLHHIDKIDPLFAGMSRHESLRHFFTAVDVDPAGALQQSLCYHTRRRWSIQVSWGYAVQVTRNLLPPRLLELPMRTFTGWGVKSFDESFSFRTREMPNDTCERPVTFLMKSVLPISDHSSSSSISNYTRSPSQVGRCSKKDALANLSWITVKKEATQDSWYKAPTRQCCRIVASTSQSLELQVRNCHPGEITGPIV